MFLFGACSCILCQTREFEHPNDRSGSQPRANVKKIKRFKSNSYSSLRNWKKSENKQTDDNKKLYERGSIENLIPAYIIKWMQIDDNVIISATIMVRLQ